MNAVTKIKHLPDTFTIERWLTIRDYLLPSIKLLGGTHTETDIVAMLMSGAAGLWVLPNGAMVTEICTYPRLRELSILVAGGDKDELVGMQETLENHAIELGCKRFRNSGRWGWKKWEGEYTGFRFLSVSIVKDL